MKIVRTSAIKEVVARLCIKANIRLRPDVVAALRQSLRRETGKRAREILHAILYNSVIAAQRKLAICQDTGLPTVFLEIGQDVHIIGDLRKAVNDGVAAGYRRGCLRNSIVLDPLARGSGSRFSPAVQHVEITKGSAIRLTVLPKGFGCENKSQLKMFNPTAGIEAIKDFVVEAVKTAGPDACPPYVVGVGIGGTADYASLLAKKALLRNIAKHKTPTTKHIRLLEQELLQCINRLNIGPMGLGGRTTALAVMIESYPTHIAGLPVAVSISCHALRSATGLIK